jgi:hypothetical protein
MKPKKSNHGGSRKGAGRPTSRATSQIRIYTADKPKLTKHGTTTAEAVRKLLNASLWD